MMENSLVKRQLFWSDKLLSLAQSAKPRKKFQFIIQNFDVNKLFQRLEWVF